MELRAVPPRLAAYWQSFCDASGRDESHRFFEAFHFDDNEADADVLASLVLAVEIVPFGAVTAQFAATEGEGDGSLEYWRRVHGDYFGRECRRLGREPCMDMPVVCERFCVVHCAEGR